MVHGGGARSTATHPCGEAGDDIGRTFVVGGGETPGILDEICRRVLLSGGQVLAVRAADMPDGAQIAGILRYAR
ncbi:hypothetical protein IU441_13505 [Nocardia cyriacigeorgica]|nr:hypothetical protein [Nocardia cyriacigeorgica]